MPATTATDTASEFVALAAELGFTVRVKTSGYGSEHIIEVSTSFAANDAPAYCAAESGAYHLLALAPMTYPGSQWGSFGDGVGGHAALVSGSAYFCKSGVGSRWARKVAKLAGVTIEVGR